MATVAYARVSTRAQNEESQLDILGDHGYDKLFVDKVSGKLASRPEWDKALEYLRSGDTLVVTRLSRMARSVRNLTEVAAELEERGITLVVLMQNIDTSTPTGRFTFHILAAVDEFQADIISDNTREGLAAARARGRVGGRKPKLNAKQVAQVRKMAASGEHSIVDIAETFEVSRPTIYAVLKAEEPAAAS